MEQIAYIPPGPFSYMDDGSAAYSVKKEVEHGYYEYSRIPFSNGMYNYEAFPDPGYRFCGWFSEGTLIPGEQSCRSSDPAMKNAVPEFLPEYPFVLTLGGYLTTYSLGITYGIPGIVARVTVEVLDLSTKKRKRMSFEGSEPRREMILDPGEYKVRERIRTVHGYEYMNVERVITGGTKISEFAVNNPYNICFESGHVSMSGGKLRLKMSQKWYRRYRTTPIRRYYSRMEMINLAPYLALDDPVIREVAAALSAASEQMEERGRAETIFRFVQGLKSRSDYITTGCQDYFKFPPETLWDGAGDCECKVILLIALFKLNGFDTVFHHGFVGSEPHIAAGVALKDAYGTTHTVEGREYVFCEPTLYLGRGKGLGCYPKDFRLTGSHKV